MKLSDYVRSTVSAKGLSSYDVERRSRGQISFGYVNDIINEKTTNPTVKKLQALAQGLGVSEDELFRVARGLSLEYEENPMDTELIAKFNLLTEDRKQEMLHLFDFYGAYDVADYEITGSDAVIKLPGRKRKSE